VHLLGDQRSLLVICRSICHHSPCKTALDLELEVHRCCLAPLSVHPGRVAFAGADIEVYPDWWKGASSSGGCSALLLLLLLVAGRGWNLSCGWAPAGNAHSTPPTLRLLPCACHVPLQMCLCSKRPLTAVRWYAPCCTRGRPLSTETLCCTPVCAGSAQPRQISSAMAAPVRAPMWRHVCAAA
jgi:hypothetical protein